MIAFVVVAAALAFVVLNMGMFTTQRAREVIARGLGEASSALEVDGSVTAVTNSNGEVTLISIPIKLAPGREVVDLNKSKTNIAIFISSSKTGASLAYEDAHGGVLYGSSVPTSFDLLSLRDDTKIQADSATVVFVKEVTSDTVLEFGEKALVIIKLSNGLGPYDKIRVEIRPPEGAPLTVERMIPAILPANQAVTLG